MIIRLAPEYEQAYQAAKSYFSYTFEYETSLTPAMMLQAFDPVATRFFWQTPDQSLTLLGIGEVFQLPSAKSQQMHQQKERLRTQLFDPSQACRLVGALPFDPQAKKAPLWDELAEGGFVLPEIELVYQDHRWHVTLIVKRPATYAQLALDFNQLQQRFFAAVTTSHPKKDNHVQATEELAVTQWLTTVEEAVATIKDPGNPLEKIVLARQLRLEMEREIDGAQLVQRLLVQQPQTYVFFLQRNERIFVGATPERLLAGETDTIYTAAVAGSIERGQTADEDQTLGAALLHSAKNLHEHQIVVDRIRKAIAPFTQNQVTVGERTLLKNRDIQHLYAPIVGKRQAKGPTFLDMIDQLHPTPALGGEPKEAALHWLRHHEPVGRGLYGAPIGWLSLAEDGGEFAVGIRSAVLYKQHALLYAGCGIVADSVAIEERAETSVKFQPMKRGISDEDPTTNHD